MISAAGLERKSKKDIRLILDRTKIESVVVGKK